MIRVVGINNIYGTSIRVIVVDVVKQRAMISGGHSHELREAH